MKRLEWDKKIIESESDQKLAKRLRLMAEYGETEGRSIALKEAARRLVDFHNFKKYGDNI